MEKIQQAIERARQQRASLKQEVSRPGIAGARGTSSVETLVQAAMPVTLDLRHLRANRLVAAFVDDPQTDIFRSLRTQVLLRLQTLGGRSLAVVSARDGEGKTFVACNLAMSLARQAEAPVFLVDLDFRRPSLHKVLGITPRHGVSDVIEGHADLEDVLLHVADTNLFVLPQPTRQPHASELIAAARTREIIRTLVDGTRQGYVIIDCPPLLMTDEPLVVQGFVDGCLLVVQQARTSRDEIRRAAELMDETKYLGSVVNRGDAAQSQSYYGYR